MHRGVETCVVTADRSGRLARNDRQDGVDIVRVPAWPRSRDWYWAPSVPAAVRATRPDVVHVQSYHTFVAPLGMVAAVQTRTPFLVTFHGGGHSSRVRNAFRSTQVRALAPLLRRSFRLIATAQFEISLYSRLIGVGTDRFEVVPNGGDVGEVHRSADYDPSLIVSIGRLERYKGHHRSSRPASRYLRTARCASADSRNRSVCKLATRLRQFAWCQRPRRV